LLSLTILDDDGGVILNSLNKPASCESGGNTHVKFWVEYKGPENCKDSAVPAQQTSRGELFVTATASGGVLNDKLGIQCKK
jgi:hypothetical protein